ncbi:MAG TPA: hypothetical protein VIV11_38250 [Kofleriaceae bacterium]
MRVAWFCVAALTAACAKGGNAGDVDGGNTADTTIVTIDALFCNNLPCDAIYVSRSGNDTAAGTKTAPLKTISVGIAKAAANTPPFAVFVQAGLYPEPVVMRAAVTVYGGFDETWIRNPAVITEINAPSPAVIFDQIQTGTGLDGLTVRSGDATAPGTSSYAIVINNSQAITLTDVIVESGIGARGTDGNNGAAGANGGNAGNGQPGCEDSGGFCSGCGQPQGGGAGASACGRSGGRGGHGGHGGGGGGNGVDAVGYPQSGAFGGPAGAGQFGTPGGTGANGTPGGVGMWGGAGGEVGVFEGPLYMPSNGGNGGVGSHGLGGGGGGGGGGGDDDCDSYGASGGGGGGGGCGGGLGTAGTGGGGSFGVVAIDSGVTIKSSTVLASRGGDGGRGGSGGTGGFGGNRGVTGGYGGGSEQDDGGMGGPGGFGGAGGIGGHGGGGGGGPSAALVCVGSTTMTIPMSTIMGGTGGLGGPSQGFPGATGVSTKFIGCSFF